MDRVDNPARRRLFRGRLRKAPVLRLPWVISENTFLDNCTQCQACISICETNILVRDEDRYPKVDFNKGECSFCNKCIEVCEAPLFKEQRCEKPWPIELSIENSCLAKNNIYCQSCRDECEAGAIKFCYKVDGKTMSIPQPVLNIDDCTQCGACLTSCPSEVIKVKFFETM